MTQTPLRPDPLFLEKPWGGPWFRRLFGARAPADCGEVWLCSTMSGAKGTLVKGAPLARLVAGPVPLVKLLHSSHALSVQLHPDHDLARRLHGPGHQGKWESWYFLEAPSEGFVYHGLREGADPAELVELVRRGKSPEELLRKVPVEAGDALIVPPGTLHVLTAGAVVYEAQNPSDLTYRFYDWGRPGLDGRPRELHIEQGEAALASRPAAPAARKPRRIPGAPGRHDLSTCGPVHCELLVADEGPVALPADLTGQPLTLTALDGRIELRSRAKAWEPELLAPGQCLVIPAGSGELLVGGTGKGLISWLAPLSP